MLVSLRGQKVKGPQNWTTKTAFQAYECKVATVLCSNTEYRVLRDKLRTFNKA